MQQQLACARGCWKPQLGRSFGRLCGVCLEDAVGDLWHRGPARWLLCRPIPARADLQIHPAEVRSTCLPVVCHPDVARSSEEKLKIASQIDVEAVKRIRARSMEMVCSFTGRFSPVLIRVSAVRVLLLFRPSVSQWAFASQPFLTTWPTPPTKWTKKFVAISPQNLEIFCIFSLVFSVLGFLSVLCLYSYWLA